MRFIVLSVLLLTACVTQPLDARRELASKSVSITNLKKNSGGSGTVIASSDDASFILTNSHVCKVVKFGGLVITDDGQEYLVVDYMPSQIHDLCLIRIKQNLHIETIRLVDTVTTYGPAVVAGHPKLSPTIITEGYFAHKTIIQIVMSVRPCTEEEMTGVNAAFCAFMGGIPIIRNYQSQMISALIQPGSSGSGVFDEHGKLSGVVFAGSGDIGYGFIVPLEFVKTFLLEESKSLPFITPADVDLGAPVEEKSIQCDKISDPSHKEICNSYNNYVKQVEL